MRKRNPGLLPNCGGFVKRSTRMPPLAAMRGQERAHLRSNDLLGTYFLGKTKLLAVCRKKSCPKRNSNPLSTNLFHKHHHRIPVCIGWDRSCSRKVSNDTKMLYVHFHMRL